MDRRAPEALPAGTAQSRRRLTEPEHGRIGEAARAVLVAYPEVVAAYLFGSAARGEPARDLDLGLVLRRGPVDFHRVEAIASALQQQGAPAGPEIDLRLLVGAAPRFRATVVREGKLLYEADPAARIAFEAQAMSEWIDFRPAWERLRSAMLRRWAHG